MSVFVYIAIGFAVGNTFALVFFGGARASSPPRRGPTPPPSHVRVAPRAYDWQRQDDAA